MRFIMLAFVFATLLQAPPPVRTLVKGALSGIEARREVVVRSADEWAALWKQHGAREPAPAVDFSREMVVGVFLGRRDTGGYGVEIVRVVGNSGVTVVEYVESAPSADAITAQILTAPYHLAAIPKQGGEITFREIRK